MGFDNDINKLDTVFNGIITVLEDQGVLVYVQAEGFGRELVQQEHSEEIGDDTFLGSANTAEILADLLHYPEIEHFGNYQIQFFAGQDPEARRLTWLHQSGFGSIKNRIFTNIYIDQIEKIDSAFGAFDLEDLIAGVPTGWTNTALNPFNGRQLAYDFPIFQATPWTNLKEMEYRHPGTLSKPVLYGDRMSYFFGIKEQLYIYRDLHHILQQQYFFGAGSSTNNSLYQRLRFLRFKPVCDFHILSTDHNIILNRLKLSNDFGTVASIQHYDDHSHIKDNDFNHYEMKVDDNLIPSEHRKVYFGDKHGTGKMLGAHGEYLAIRYGTTYLQKELETMYDGTITLLGNPKIKAGDYAAVFDDIRGMTGIIKIREAVHHYSVQDGYTTTITPGLYVESANFNYSNLFTRLFLTSVHAMALTKAKVQTAYQSSRDFINLTFSLRLLQEYSGRVSSDPLNAGEESNDEEIAAMIMAGLAFVGVSTNYKHMMNAKTAGVSVNAGRYVATNVDKFLRFAGGIPDTDKFSSTAGGRLRYIGSVIGGGTVKASSAIFTRPAVRATPDLTSKSLLDKVKHIKHWRSTKILGTMARLGFATGRFAAAATWAGGPLGWTAGLAIMYMAAYQEEQELVRQPFKIFPLQVNGRSFVGGIAGYEQNGYFPSLAQNFADSWDDFSYLTDLLVEMR
jgi:hypothetical protein